ncbi:hypothetical protein [[Acholeplasma] multilocale]|uniref:hypothetical protein n=1 Tax=[Acholeplasma] multilocale TaxID=264638 RepID=UPI00047EDA56|nr:hypothetical protein [[Acholeplasma] multilocale]
MGICNYCKLNPAREMKVLPDGEQIWLCSKDAGRMNLLFAFLFIWFFFIGFFVYFLICRNHGANVYQTMVIRKIEERNKGTKI